LASAVTDPAGFPAATSTEYSPKSWIFLFCDRAVRLMALAGLVACSASALRFFRFPVAVDAGLAAGAASASRSGAVRNRFIVIEIDKFGIAMGSCKKKLTILT